LASSQHHRRSLHASGRLMRSDDSTMAGLPASSPRRCCRRNGQTGPASSAPVVLAHRSALHLRSAPLAPDPCFRGVAASTSGGWRASGAHRGSVWCLLTAVRPAIGGDMSRRQNLGWATWLICPVVVSVGRVYMVALPAYKRSPVRVEALARDAEGLVLAEQTAVVRGCGRGIGLGVPEGGLLLVRGRLPQVSTMFACGHCLA